MSALHWRSSASWGTYISKSKIVNDWARIQQFLVRMKADCERTRRSRSAASQTRFYHQSSTGGLGAGCNRA